MLILILRYVFLVYAVIFACCGWHLIATLITSILVGALFIYKLPKSNPRQSDSILMTGKVCVIAHRGAGHDAPENTLGAIREAKKNGADAVEFDVDYTTDNVAVVIHDDTVDRTTDGTGTVSKMSYGQLKQLSASAKHPKMDQFPKENVPTLEETVLLCLELGLKMYIDVKGSAKKSADILPKLFQKYQQLYQNAIVCSFFPQTVYLVKRNDLGIVTALTHRHNVMTRKVDGTEHEGRTYQKLLYPILDVLHEWSIYTWLWYFCGTSAFLVHVGEVSKKMMDFFKRRGIHVVGWTANSPHDKNYLKHSLQCSYITDTLLNETTTTQHN